MVAGESEALRAFRCDYAKTASSLLTSSFLRTLGFD
jgi:hypothetical protein